MVNGKAKLVREDRCDGSGACLPECPEGAMALIEKDVPPFNSTPDEIIIVNKTVCDCIGIVKNQPKAVDGKGWPMQLKMTATKAPSFDGADLLIAADCTAFACKDFHERFAKNRALLIGCPKLDHEEYGQRISKILDGNDVRSITLVRMNVQCCGEFARMVREAVAMSVKSIPLSVHVLSTDGIVLE
jgi:ferredoxin